jgi:hypothetical protein
MYMWKYDVNNLQMSVYPQCLTQCSAPYSNIGRNCFEEDIKLNSQYILKRVYVK